MARGFKNTLGVDVNDKIVSALTAHALQRTYAIWTYRRAGGAVLGRLFDKSVELLTHGGGAGTTYDYGRQFSGNDGNWLFDAPSADAWHSVVLVYDASDVGNDPVVYVDGSPVTVTQNGTPTGSPTNNANSYVIGSRAADTTRVWDGMLAEFAVWDRLLSSSEAADYHNEVSPLAMATSLVEYIPMLQADDPVTSCIITDPTVTGTLATAHPFASQGCSAGTSILTPISCNVVLMPGVPG